MFLYNRKNCYFAYIYLLVWFTSTHELIILVLKAYLLFQSRRSSGTLDALKPTPYILRTLKYTVKGAVGGEGLLKPYVCNFLVDSKYRKLGYAKLLLKECEFVAKKSILIFYLFDYIL